MEALNNLGRDLGKLTDAGIQVVWKNRCRILVGLFTIWFLAFALGTIADFAVGS
jgi:hypothetical protein